MSWFRPSMGWIATAFAMTIALAWLAVAPAAASPAASAAASRAPSTVGSKIAVTPPSRCLKYPGKTICASKGLRRIFAINNGVVLGSAIARFGGRASDGSGPWFTREGVFHTFLKNSNQYSTLYHVYMPWYQQFSGGQGVHFSYEFANAGYRYSHGCIGMKDWKFAKWLYQWAPLHTRVVVVRR